MPLTNLQSLIDRPGVNWQPSESLKGDVAALVGLDRKRKYERIKRQAIADATDPQTGRVDQRRLRRSLAAIDPESALAGPDGNGAKAGGGQNFEAGIKVIKGIAPLYAQVADQEGYGRFLETVESAGAGSVASAFPNQFTPAHQQQFLRQAENLNAQDVAAMVEKMSGEQQTEEFKSGLKIGEKEAGEAAETKKGIAIEQVKNRSAENVARINARAKGKTEGAETRVNVMNMMAKRIEALYPGTTGGLSVEMGENGQLAIKTGKSLDDATAAEIQNILTTAVKLHEREDMNPVEAVSHAAYEVNPKRHGKLIRVQTLAPDSAGGATAPPSAPSAIAPNAGKVVDWTQLKLKKP